MLSVFNKIRTSVVAATVDDRALNCFSLSLFVVDAEHESAHKTRVFDLFAYLDKFTLRAARTGRGSGACFVLLFLRLRFLLVIAVARTTLQAKLSECTLIPCRSSNHANSFGNFEKSSSRNEIAKHMRLTFKKFNLQFSIFLDFTSCVLLMLHFLARASLGQHHN